jgi:hypothetical protein
MDLSKRDLQSFETIISKITGANGKGGIEDPKFPREKDLETTLFRIAAIIVSDCHLRERGLIKYSESELDRIRIVEDIFSMLGNIKFNPTFNKEDNHYDVYFPSVIGRAFIHMGLLAGDKTIQNAGIGLFLDRMSWAGASAFMQELIPQDGSVSIGRIDWSHSHALYPGLSDKDYTNLAIISEEEVNFIKNKGERSRGSRRLSWGTILDWKNSASSETARIAANLANNILNNPNNLICAEELLSNKLHVKTVPTPDQIRYFTKTGRVSVSWQGRTANSIEAMKLAIVAPPNDVNKRSLLEEWLRSNPDDVEEVCQYYMTKGITLHRWWEDGHSTS